MEIRCSDLVYKYLVLVVRPRCRETWTTNGRTVLGIGKRIDRRGQLREDYVLPEGTAYPKRGLPADSIGCGYHGYEELKPLPVERSLVSPASGGPGLGVQFKLEKPVPWYVTAGHVRKCTDERCGLSRTRHPCRQRGEYTVNDFIYDGPGLPNNMTAIEPTHDERGAWTAYFTERGEISDQHSFATEGEACRFVLARDIYSIPPPVYADTETRAERAARRQAAQDRVDRYVADLRDRGLLGKMTPED